MISFDEYLKKFNKLAQKYIPPRNEWTPPDDAVYGVKDIFRVPEKEAKELRLKAIKFQFKRHYEKNSFYRRLCKERKISPDDIKREEDFKKIPLIPDKFFKNYPSGRDFAIWLSNIITGDIPEIEIPNKNPSYDEVVESFNSAGMAVAYSSGTSGRFTFIPRDERTFKIAQYAAAKSIVINVYPLWDYNIYGYLLMPNPFKTNVFAGKICGIYFDLIKEVEVAIDKRISTRTVSRAMSGGRLRRYLLRHAIGVLGKRVVKNIIKWLDLHSREKDSKMALVGAPALMHSVLIKLKEEGKNFDLFNRVGIITGGGWKVQEDKRIPVSNFRKLAEEVLGINPMHCLDVYGMVEGNGFMVHCPEGHYLHVPYTFFYPMVLDENLEPKGFGEQGRFAFLDGTTFSYPGFIITGDSVKLLERCPACDRPGPVLEPEVKRMGGEEVRGCAEEVRRMLSI